MMILRASQGWLIPAMVTVEVPWPVRYMSFGVVIITVSNHILFYSHGHIVAINKVAINAIIIIPWRYIGNSLNHPQFAFQTADGSYKLVGIVNWGGGYCGEVQSHQHCFLRKQLRSLHSR